LLPPQSQTFYSAIEKLPLADAVTLFYCSPTITTIAAFALLGERISLLVRFFFK
jgi:drug/metabolite transporter (DMT)-like permease